MAADATHNTGTDRRENLLLGAIAVLLLGGGASWAAGLQAVTDASFALATAIAFVPAVVDSVRQLARRELGVDVIALLAMAGALALGEFLAGAIIALMLTGGEALERHAAGRARRELTNLLQRAPTTAHRRSADGQLTDVPVDEVVVGEVLVVKPGEVLPTDGLLLGARAILDTSALTGESLPVEVTRGHALQSGSVNSGPPVELRVTAPARESTYAGIVRLVEQAAGERPPFARMADRYAGGFVLVTLLLAGGAWLVTGDPVRALAVLVVATPCPLILAAPAAIVGGLSHAARRGIIVKGGAALEALAAGRVVLLDKTGTVTAGRPAVARVHSVTAGGTDELLRLAGSLEQVSMHPFAPALVAAATERGLRLSMPEDVEEELGAGVAGRVEGRQVRVGQSTFVTTQRGLPVELRRAVRRSLAEGSSAVHVAVDGELAGTLIVTDPIRPEAPAAIRSLRRSGIDQILLVTGDRTEVAELVGETLGVDRVLAERAPEEKVLAVREAAAFGPTIMVGDGINDAPALALAGVGVAMGARGATAASQAADVVLTADRLGGLGDAVRIARRTQRIAWESIVVGMGLSAIAMLFAAAGHLPPVAGALLQEGIDIAVILNALRALRPARGETSRRMTASVPAGLLTDHHDLRHGLDAFAELADRLPGLDSAEAARRLADASRFLVDELLPHELAEEQELYPVLARLHRDDDPTAVMARSHRAIARQVRLFARLTDEFSGDELEREEIAELQRSMWSLHAVLDLHLALEDELFALLVPRREAARSEPDPDDRTPRATPATDGAQG